MIDGQICQLRQDAYESALLLLSVNPKEPEFTTAQKHLYHALAARYQLATPEERAYDCDPNRIAFERFYTGWKES